MNSRLLACGGLGTGLTLLSAVEAPGSGDLVMKGEGVKVRSDARSRISKDPLEGSALSSARSRKRVGVGPTRIKKS